MQYFKDGDEKMVAFQLPDEDTVYGVLYMNRFGAFIRDNQSWVSVTPDDDTFDETIPFDVNEETVEDFLAAYDAAEELPVSDAMQYLTSTSGED
jgi:hypothetical protein